MRFRRMSVYLAYLAAIGSLVSVSATQVGSFSRSFSISPGGNLQIAISSGDVEIETWDRNEVAVEVAGISAELQQYLEVQQNGNDISIGFQPRNNRWSSRGARFEIRMPVAFNVDLNTAGGDISVIGNITGRFKGKTAGGDIDLDNVDGDVDLRTSGGDIEAGTVGGDAILRTSGGDISLGQVTGMVDVSTSGGDISVASIGQSLKASTAGGDIHLGDVGGEATASTAGGDVVVGDVSGSAKLNTAGGDVILKGASGQVTAATAGGDISLEQITGSINASTAGGDIRATLYPSGTGRSELKTAGGDVHLSLPQTSQATITAIIHVQDHGGDSWAREAAEYDIHSDFAGMNYTKDANKRQIRADFVINGGGEQILLETTNGDIYIRNAPQ